MCCSRHGWTRRPPGASSAPARAPRWHQITTGGYVGNIQTRQVLAFCVGDHSVQIKLRDVQDVRDGDRVTLAGKLKLARSSRWHCVTTRPAPSTPTPLRQATSCAAS